MRLTLATRIFLGYAAVLFTFGAVSLFAVLEMRRSQEEIRLVAQGYLYLLQTTADIEGFFSSQASDITELHKKNPAVRRMVMGLARSHFTPEMNRKIAEGHRRAQEALSFASGSESLFVKEFDDKLTELEVMVQRYTELREESFKTLERSNDEPVGENEKAEGVTALQTQINANLRRLHARVESRILDRVEKAKERERRTGALIITLSVITIFVGLLATLVAARALRPIQTLIAGVSRIGRGDYSAKLGFAGKDEIAQLSREFDAMAKRLKEREEQLLQAERLAAMGRVAAQISHEIRNPLSSIGLNAEMISEHLQSAQFSSAEEGKEARELLDKVAREVDRLTEITEEYLRLARLPPPSLKREDLNQILSAVVDFSREDLVRQAISISQVLAPAPILAMVDDGQIRQVLLNLIRNAREAMSDTGGGTLTVSTELHENQVAIRIADTGPGLTPEAKQRLFEPFFSTKKGGTGLGLSLSQQIIVAHQGKLEVEAGPTGGAHFVIRLPKA